MHELRLRQPAATGRTAAAAALMVYCSLPLAASADPVATAAGTATATTATATASRTATPTAAGTTTAIATTSTAVPPAPGVAAPLSAAQVIEVLDQTVDWYRSLGIQQQAANEPSDLLILYDNRQTASKVMSLAFDVARADADMLGKQTTAGDDDGAADGVSSQGLEQLRKKLDTQIASTQSELDRERRHLADAPAKSKIDIQAKINELQSELDLVNTKKTILGTLTGFAAGEGGSTAGALKAQIDAMAVAIPSSFVPSASGTAPPGTAPTQAQPQTALGLSAAPAASGQFGLWDLASNAYRQSQKAATVLSIDRRTAALQATLARIRAPLVAEIKALSAHGDALGAQADSADSTALNDVRNQLDVLDAQFKLASALLIPLSREAVLLTQYRRNLANWHDVIRSQYRNALKTLGIRLAALLVLLALLFGGAELWRRTVLRYIQDSRRRYQLLLLRRIALWSLIVIVVGVAFASELGSIVTFAGLITAGIAVAMQSVLVSIVGYFFLIGKYGIRVGDRIQIGEVAGEVIDLGLVRMYLMELGAKGTMGPTGRVVAFANSVVFQVAGGLFKQIPGVNFSWRDVTLSLPAGADYVGIKEKLTIALTDALKDYLGEIRRQTKEIERATSSPSAGDAEPQVQLHFSATGVEAHVRYPVQLQHAAQIDERVTEALSRVVSPSAAR